MKQTCDQCGTVWQTTPVKTGNDPLSKLQSLRRYSENATCPECTTHNLTKRIGSVPNKTEKNRDDQPSISIDIKLPRYTLDKDVYLPALTKTQIDEALTKVIN